MGYLIIQFNLIQLTLFIILYLVRYLRDLGFVYKLMPPPFRVPNSLRNFAQSEFKLRETLVSHWLFQHHIVRRDARTNVPNTPNQKSSSVNTR